MIAPADAFATVAVSPTALRFGMTTPWAPAWLAVLIMDPRLCGSSILSRNIIKGGSPFSSAILNISSIVPYS